LSIDASKAAITWASVLDADFADVVENSENGRSCVILLIGDTDDDDPDVRRKRNETTGTCPPFDASVRAVTPLSPTKEVLAPCDTRKLTTLMCPLAAASMRGENPFLF
jgi:hypothetical protein